MHTPSWQDTTCQIQRPIAAVAPPCATLDLLVVVVSANKGLRGDCSVLHSYATVCLTPSGPWSDVLRLRSLRKGAGLARERRVKPAPAKQESSSRRP